MRSRLKRVVPPAWRRRLAAWHRAGVAFAQDPVVAYQALLNWPAMQRGHRIAAGWRDESQAVTAAVTSASAPNPLWDYFSGHNTGPGIFKVKHYFELYHRPLARFVGQPALLADVGELGGGSLAMWADYLGPQSQIYGIDIQPECRPMRGRTS